MPRKSANGIDVQEIASAWGVTTRTVHNWRHRFGDAVVLDRDRLAKSLLNDTRTHLDVREAARSIASADEGDPGVAAVTALNDLPDLRRRTEGHLAAADADIIACRKAGDKGGEAAATKRYREFASTLTNVIRAQALIGQDAGELIAKGDAKRMVFAWATRAALGIQRIRDHYAPKLLNLQDETAACEVLDDALISQMFLAPFARAVEAKAGTALPEWLVDEVSRAVGDLVSNGESELRKEMDGHRVA